MESLCQRRRALSDEGGPGLSEARALALAMLGRREYSRHELEAKLQRKGCSAVVAAETASALESQRLLSDRRFTEAVVSARRRRGYGPIRIQHELKDKGVGQDLIGEALAAAGDWIGELRQVRAKRFGESPPATAEARAKQIRFLQSRGFTFDQIRQALNSQDFD